MAMALSKTRRAQGRFTAGFWLRGHRLCAWLLLHVCLPCCCSRTFINDTPVAFDPERAMAELVLHTHYLPRHWRGRAHTAEVQQSVNSMFTLKVCVLGAALGGVVLRRNAQRSVS